VGGGQVRAEDELVSLSGASEGVRALGRRGFRVSSRVLRVLPQALCGLAAIVAFRLGGGWDVVGGCLGWTAVTGNLWRAGGGAGFGSVLVRRRARRVACRVGIVLVYAGICAVSVAAVRDGLLAGAVGVVLVEPVVWRAYPGPLRDAYQRARIQMAVAEAEPKWLGQRYGFDPGQGAVGRPGPVDFLEPSLPGGPMTQRPSVPVAEATGGLLASEAAGLATWWRYGRIAWDGAVLSVTDAHIQTTVLPLHRDDGAPDHVAEIVWCSIYRSEWSGTAAASLRRNRVLFLDTAGRQYARIPSLGFKPDQIRLIAQEAGLTYREYSIGVGSYRLAGLDALLFPPRRDTLVVRIW
jgi:hypothetical protein